MSMEIRTAPNGIIIFHKQVEHLCGSRIVTDVVTKLSASDLAEIITFLNENRNGFIEDVLAGEWK